MKTHPSFLRLLATTCALIGSGLGMGTAQAGTLLNGSFAQGLDSWQTTGDVIATAGLTLGIDLGSQPLVLLGTASPEFDDDAPDAAGQFNLSGQAPMETAPADGLEAWLGLNAATLGSNAYEGSALRQTVDVTAGAQLSFDWQLLTRDNGTRGNEPDQAWLTLGQNGQTQLIALGNVGSLPMQTGTNNWLLSQPGHVSIVVQQGGPLTIGFVIADVNSFGNTSLLAVREVAITPGVPEPAGLTLALIGAAFMLRRTHRMRDRMSGTHQS